MRDLESRGLFLSPPTLTDLLKNVTCAHFLVERRPHSEKNLYTHNIRNSTTASSSMSRRVKELKGP